MNTESRKVVCMCVCAGAQGNTTNYNYSRKLPKSRERDDGPDTGGIRMTEIRPEKNLLMSTVELKQ